MSEPDTPELAAQNPWGDRPPQGYYGYPVPRHWARPVSGLGIATQVLLAVQLLASIALLFPVLHERTLIAQLTSDPGSVTLPQAQRADDTVNSLNLVVMLLYVATGIVWIIWFYRARTNVEAWSPQYQRRRAGWAIGGWFCPVVNLWFPYLIAKDVLDDTERDVFGVRNNRPLLLGWWLMFDALFVISLVDRSKAGANTLDELSGYVDVVLTGIVFRIVAAVLAVLVVRQVTAAQTARMHRAVR